ncbi:hypothetical protein [Legionella shakespearei]|uniref:Dot/Icm T4SS effector n=1 Tax=Legionella shakespearei DSM 23087 TaxID=1122169 RepID=A0A0W0YMC6_9GAMM|nr:hypothetical protein [Legionella shakespearei]KTD57731.1 Dot/Icm T4SS effector [Legionella shakespearei DSM 23087]
MTGIMFYSDFDGTLTQRAGNNTVFSPFYQSLLEGYKPGIPQHYKISPLKSATEVQQLFTAKFGVYDTNFDHKQTDVDMLITPEAVAFLHQVLKNDKIHVRIVTKNRKDYIQAMMHYQGFTAEEIFKLEILDSGFKFQSVNQDLRTQLWTKEMDQVYVLDDSKEDLDQMLLAIQMYGFQAEQIHQYNLNPGQFAWLDYLRTIQNNFPAAEDSVSETTPSSPVVAHNAPPVTSSFAHHAALQQSTEAAQAPALPVQHFESPLAKPEGTSDADELLIQPLNIRTSG